MPETDIYLRSTETIDYDTKPVGDRAQELVKRLTSDREKAVSLYYFVRDGIRHNAYAPLYDIELYKASVILDVRSGICQQKAILLSALARAAGIPTRLGFVDVHDHQLSESFKQMIGGVNVFPFHGFAELLVDGKWLHLSPSYDIATCQRNGFVPVEFDGLNHARDSTRTVNGEPHMEHIRYHGPYDDFPWDEIQSYYNEWAGWLGLAWDEHKDAGNQVRQLRSWGER